MKRNLRRSSYGFLTDWNGNFEFFKLANKTN